MINKLKKLPVLYVGKASFGLSIIITFSILLLSGCIDKIDFDNVEEENFLSIDVRISSNASEQKIFFSKSNQLGAFQLPKVNPEDVKVVTGSGESFVFGRVNDGEYVSSFNLNENEEYQLNFTYEGDEYVSTWQKLPELPKIDTLYYEFERLNIFQNGIDQQSRGYNVFAKLDPTSQAKYFRWKTSATYERQTILNSFGEDVCVKCWLDINFSPKLTVDQQIPAQDDNISQITYLPYSDQFVFLYRLNMDMESLSEDAFLYWEAVETILNQSGSVFDPTPFQVQSNISSPSTDNMVFGYFYLTNKIRRRMFIRRLGIEGQPTPLNEVPRQNCLDAYPEATCVPPEGWPLN